MRYCAAAFIFASIFYLAGCASFAPGREAARVKNHNHPKELTTEPKTPVSSSEAGDSDVAAAVAPSEGEATPAAEDAPAASQATVALAHSGGQKKMATPPAREGRLALPAVAKLVFIRSSVPASAVDAALYEIRQGQPYFLTQVKNNTQVHLNIGSGSHVYMLMAGDSVDFLELQSHADKTYYCIIRPRLGAWNPSFAFQAIKQRDQATDEKGTFFGDDLVEQMLSAMTPIVELHDREAVRAGSDVVKKFHAQWPLWRDSDQSKKEGKVLSVSDGR